MGSLEFLDSIVPRVGAVVFVAIVGEKVTATALSDRGVMTARYEAPVWEDGETHFRGLCFAVMQSFVRRGIICSIDDPPNGDSRLGAIIRATGLAKASSAKAA